jgi:hypothetical protein
MNENEDKRKWGGVVVEGAVWVLLVLLVAALAQCNG